MIGADFSADAIHNMPFSSTYPPYYHKLMLQVDSIEMDAGEKVSHYTIPFQEWIYADDIIIILLITTEQQQS